MLKPILTVLGALLALSGATRAAPLATALRPNLLFILADDLGYGDLGAYGSEIRTPHLDTLARDGARFDPFYAAGSVCTPSRYGFLTGHYPARSRDQLLGALMFLEGRDDRKGLRADETTIARVLRDGGYRTALIGKWHLGHGQPEFLPQNHGFEHTYGCHGGCVDYFTLRYGQKPDWYRHGEPLEEVGYSTDLITAEAVRWLRDQRQGAPFFLFLSYTAPHYGKGWDPVARKTTNPLQAKPEDRARFADIADPARREYAAMVAAMDDGVGRVLATLREAGRERDTLVIFTSDNGGDLDYGGHNGRLRGEKGQLFEGGIREPCLMRWPGRIAPGKRIQVPTTNLDLFPTFAELAGIDAGRFAPDGHSLVPLLLGTGTLPADRVLFWHQPRARALRQGPWKWVQDGNASRLFHLERDPEERRDLAEEEPARRRELEARHTAILSAIRDSRPAAGGKPGKASTKR